MILKEHNIPIFESRIKKTETCWLWTGSIRTDGYGRFPVQSKYYGAHRLAYELYVGPLESDKLVRHKCDNPLCVNPDHLELGTPQENVHDMYKRKRAPDKSGKSNPNYKHGNKIGKFENRVFK